MFKSPGLTDYKVHEKALELDLDPTPGLVLLYKAGAFATRLIFSRKCAKPASLDGKPESRGLRAPYALSLSAIWLRPQTRRLLLPAEVSFAAAKEPHIHTAADRKDFEAFFTAPFSTFRRAFPFSGWPYFFTRILYFGIVQERRSAVKAINNRRRMTMATKSQPSTTTRSGTVSIASFSSATSA